MSQPINAQTDESGLRWYTFNGEKLLSATSLRRVLGMSFGLHNWVLSQVIDAATTTRSQAHLLNEDEYRKSIRKAATLQRDAAAALGTSVHEAAEHYVKAASLSPSDERKPFLAQYEAWQEAMKPTILLNEAQVFNLSLGYAGSLDLIAEVGGKNTLIDLKTGKGIYNDHALQLALYFGAEFVGGYDPYTDSDVIYEMQTRVLQSCTDMAVLHLRPDRWEYIPIPITDELAAAAVDLTRLARWFADHPTLDSLKGATTP